MSPARIDLPIDAIVEQLNAGDTFDDVARRYGCARNTVRRTVREAGVNVVQRRTTRAHEAPRSEFLFDWADWMEDALCVQTDPDAFFPEGTGASTKAAKAICRRCTVRAECLDYALDHHESFGVWGGLSERQRRKLQAARAVS